MTKKTSQALTSLESLKEFYEKIPESKWITSDFGDGEGNFCALGHLGYKGDDSSKDLAIAKKLDTLFGKKNKDHWEPHYIWKANDGETFSRIKTPKARVLALINNTLARMKLKNRRK